MRVASAPNNGSGTQQLAWLRPAPASMSGLAATRSQSATAFGGPPAASRASARWLISSLNRGLGTRSTLAEYAKPLRAKSVHAITTEDALECLSPFGRPSGKLRRAFEAESSRPRRGECSVANRRSFRVSVSIGSRPLNGPTVRRILTSLGLWPSHGGFFPEAPAGGRTLAGAS